VFEEFRQAGTTAEKVEGTGARTHLVPEVCRAARRADLGEERAGCGLDVQFYAPDPP